MKTLGIQPIFIARLIKTNLTKRNIKRLYIAVMKHPKYYKQVNNNKIGKKNCFSW